MMPMIILFVCCGLAIVAALILLNKSDATTESGTADSTYTAENSSGYAGATEDGSQVYWVVNADLTEGTYAMQAADGTLTIYDGPVSASNGVYTQTDSKSGDSVSFTITPWTDSSGQSCYALTNTADSTLAIVYGYDMAEVRSQIAVLENK
jgi:hypothetical protein